MERELLDLLAKGGADASIAAKLEAKGITSFEDFVRLMTEESQVRPCGECKACCITVPVEEFDKPGDTACQHLCDKGCGIYNKRPLSCLGYQCAWITGFGDEYMRPDLCGFIIEDMAHTMNSVVPRRTIWVDPERAIKVIRAPAFQKVVNYFVSKGEIANVQVGMRVRFSAHIISGFALQHYTSGDPIKSLHSWNDVLKAVRDGLKDTANTKPSDRHKGVHSMQHGKRR